ncbi:MAG: heme exporter protein CcmB [Anaerolineae bacterium]|jgi:heme exporter protein B|nr:heme exporter protein CcmB [Anaerolineae bacterium]
MTTPLWRTVFSIIRKDLRAELRSRELVSTMVLFALLSVLVFSFALELDRTARQEVVNGILWVTLVFASILGLNRSLATERELGGMDAMMISPIPRMAIYLGKMVGNFLFVLVVGLVLLPIMTILYNMVLIQIPLIATLILGVFGLASIGTLLAAMTAQTRSRETLLPIAMLPVIIPLLLVVIAAASTVLKGDDAWNWIAVLGLVDAIYAALGLLLFEYVIED